MSLLSPRKGRFRPAVLLGLALLPATACAPAGYGPAGYPAAGPVGGLGGGYSMSPSTGVGAAAGAVGGALLGASVAGRRDRGIGALGGAAAGALVGGLIGNAVDQRSANAQQQQQLWQGQPGPYAAPPGYGAYGAAPDPYYAPPPYGGYAPGASYGAYPAAAGKGMY